MLSSTWLFDFRDAYTRVKRRKWRTLFLDKYSVTNHDPVEVEVASRIPKRPNIRLTTCPRRQLPEDAA